MTITKMMLKIALRNYVHISSSCKHNGYKYIIQKCTAKIQYIYIYIYIYITVKITNLLVSTVARI